MQDIWKAESMLIKYMSSVEKRPSRRGRHELTLPDAGSFPSAEATSAYVASASRPVKEEFTLLTSKSKIQNILPRQISDDPVAWDPGPFYRLLYVISYDDEIRPSLTAGEVQHTNFTKLPVSVEDIRSTPDGWGDLDKSVLEKFGYFILAVQTVERPTYERPRSMSSNAEQENMFIPQEFFNSEREYTIIKDLKNIEKDKANIQVLKRRGNSTTIYIIFTTDNITLYKLLVYKDTSDPTKNVPLHPFIQDYFKQKGIKLAEMKPM